MNISIIITHELSEKTLNFLSQLLSGKVTSLGQDPGPVKLAIPDAKAPKSEKKAAIVAPLAVAPAIDNPGFTLELVRQKVVALRDAGHKEKTLAVMAEFGISALGKLPEDKYPEFMEKLNAIN